MGHSRHLGEHWLHRCETPDLAGANCCVAVHFFSRPVHYYFCALTLLLPMIFLFDSQVGRKRSKVVGDIVSGLCFPSGKTVGVGSWKREPSRTAIDWVPRGHLRASSKPQGLCERLWWLNVQSALRKSLGCENPQGASGATPQSLHSEKGCGPEWVGCWRACSYHL